MTSRISEADGAVRGRLTENLAALMIFMDNPILGVGPGQTNLYTKEYAKGIGLARIAGTRRAHNMYLEELADTGIVGFAAFMAIVLTTILSLVKVRRACFESNPELSNLATGFLLSIIGYLTTAVFLHLSYIRYYFLILALAGAIIQIYKTESSKARYMSAVTKNDNQKPDL